MHLRPPENLMRAHGSPSFVLTMAFLLAGCGSPSGKLVLLMSPPVHLQRTTDPAVCASHIPIPVFGPLLCAGDMAQPNELMLVWDWEDQYSSSPLDAGSPEGYRVYVSYNGQPPLFTGHVQADPDLTGFGVADANLTAYRCYSVRAYRGPWESVDSDPVCLGSPEGNTATVRLPASEVQNFQHYEHSSTDYFTAVGGEPAPQPGQLRAGNGNDFDRSVVGKNDWAWDADRAAVRFDLGPVGAHPAWQAVLHLHRVRTESQAMPGCEWYGACTPLQYCGGTVGNALVDWTSLPQDLLPDNDENYALPAATTSPLGDDDVKTDVTATVRAWLANAPNNGLVIQFFRGGYQEVPLYCYDYYDQPQLEVIYFQ